MFLTINKVKPHRLNKLKKKRTWDKKKILIEMDVYKRRQTERNLFSRVVRDTKPKTKTEKKKLRSITISVIQCVKRQVYVIAKSDKNMLERQNVKSTQCYISKSCHYF